MPYVIDTDGSVVFVQENMRGSGKSTKKVHRKHPNRQRMGGKADVRPGETETQSARRQVRECYGCSKTKAINVVREAKRMSKIKGGSFWSWLANTAKSVVGAIPVVGSFAKEGIDALQHHRKYNFGRAVKNATIDGAFALVPGGNLVGNVVKGAVKSGLKNATGGARAKRNAHRSIPPSRRRRNNAIKRIMNQNPGMSFIEASRLYTDMRNQ